MSTKDYWPSFENYGSTGQLNKARALLIIVLRDAGPKVHANIRVRFLQEFGVAL